MDLKPITIFVAAPGDVDGERKLVSSTAALLNRTIANRRGVHFEVSDQKPALSTRPIESHEIVIGILWKRFATPTPDQHGEAGTEHDFRIALASWRKAKKPHLLICVNEAIFLPTDAAESRRFTQVIDFREQVPQLLLSYEGHNDFRDKMQAHLEQYLADHYPLAHVPVPPALAPSFSAPARYVQALREQTSHLEIAGLCRLPIEEFYIPLATPVGTARLSLHEAMRAHSKLLVIGAPGTGKSTFVNHATHQLSKRWTESSPIPIRLEAAVLTAYIEQHRTKEDATSPHWLPIYLAAQCETKSIELRADFFRAKLKAGECCLLIDGLDETPNETSQQALLGLIRGILAVWPHCQYVITARQESSGTLDAMEEVRIAPLEPLAAVAFITKLAMELYPYDPLREQNFRQDLHAACTQNRELSKLAASPALLTALAILSHNLGQLPARRADLYWALLDCLSTRRDKPGRLPAGECLLRLGQLAVEMQNHAAGRQKQVLLAWAAEKLLRGFESQAAVERFLRAEQVDSGIVVSRGPYIGFSHLALQEFLAALEIAGWPDSEQYELLLGRAPKIYKPEWRETVRFLCGLLRNMGQRKINALIAKLLDRLGPTPSLTARVKCVGLLGALMRDLPGYTVADSRYAETLRVVMEIFDPEKSRAVPFKDRLAAAEALGQAGDPRLVEYQWVHIPATAGYLLGSQNTDPDQPHYDPQRDPEETLRRVDLPAFRIGRYPVAVAQYREFVEDGACADRLPKWWEEQQSFPNRPVIGVTWHHAAAYSRWAGARLPAAEEWERAARGPNGTRFPWGDEPLDTTRANYCESFVGHPTPVGLYPLGASPEGVEDLLGSVLEWTASKWSPSSGKYELRGCGFDGEKLHARSAYRTSSLPGHQDDDIGFRLAAN